MNRSVWQLPDGDVRVLIDPEPDEIARLVARGAEQMTLTGRKRPASELFHNILGDDSNGPGLGQAIRAGLRPEQFNLSPGTAAAFQECVTLYRLYCSAVTDFYEQAHAAHTDDLHRG